MRTVSRFGWVLMAGVLAMTGCANKDKERISLLTEENESLRAQLSDRNAALESANLEIRQLSLQSRESPKVSMQPGDSDGITWSTTPGEVRATIDSDVLFDSGRTTLKAAAKKSLDKAVQVFNSQYAGRTLRVEGHTDTDPIKKSGYKSNYHLGFERAFAVREYLISRGISANRVSLASFGPDQPGASKLQSRRVSIVAVE